MLLNMGTNLFLGKISYHRFHRRSDAAGDIARYSIFLMHRFEEEKDKHDSLKKAMGTAVSKTAVAIASSALTTIGGFAALTVMQNGIGRDLGLVLAKGITISLIVNLTLLPSLLLVCRKMSSRFKHRTVLPSFKPLSKWVVRGRWGLLIFFALLLIPSFLAQGRVEYYYSNEHYLPRIGGGAETKEILRNTALQISSIITEDEGRVREHQLVKGSTKSMRWIQ